MRLEIITDQRLTRSIESIEDALGNEVYYAFSKLDRHEFFRQHDFDEERMFVSLARLLLCCIRAARLI